MDILSKWMHPKFHLLFPNNDAVFQDYNWPIQTARSVQSWFEEHEDTLQHLPWLAQLPELNVIKSLWSENQIPSSMIPQATIRCSSWRVVQYSTRDNSELIWVYSKKDTSCITGKWWPNSILIKKCVTFTTVSIILVITWKPQSLDIGSFLIHKAMTMQHHGSNKQKQFVMSQLFS